MAKPRGMSIIDRTGQRYERLLVLSRAENRIERSGSIRARWNCLCDCGTRVTVEGKNLSRGLTRSCGCLAKEKEVKHGMSATRLYGLWRTLKQRCTNPNNTHYASYGGRGITLCEAWHDFEAFYRDVGERPRGKTLDRIDNDKGYEPGNVRWATRLEQANNRRTNVHIEFRGTTRTIAEWGRLTGLGKSAILHRLGRGWSVERALTEPIQKSDDPSEKEKRS